MKGSNAKSRNASLPKLHLDKLPRMEMKFIGPMLAKPVTELPQGADWQYEIKLDGYRALAIKKPGSARLFSRRNNVMNDKFPEIARAIQDLEDGLILDGEIVALDAQGRPSFSLLQHQKESGPVIVYYVFDLIANREKDLRGLPLRERRKLLNEVIPDAPRPIRRSVVLDAAPEDLIRVVRSHGLEGIIAKRAESRYQSGERSGLWVKFRVNRGQELVIGGYLPGNTYFDNLTAGYYNDDGKLVFVAKIKNGFTPHSRKQVFEAFRGLETNICPFDNLPEAKNARRGEALTAEAMKKYRWLKPRLVAQVEFTDWTATDHLRHSRFVALRDGKDAREAHKEPAD